MVCGAMKIFSRTLIRPYPQQSAFCSPDARLALLVVLLAFVALSHSQAPPTSSALDGTIRDAHGTAVEGATVHLLKRGASEDRKLQTDAKGEYRYAQLEGGEYTIRAEKPSLGDATFGPFTLREGQSTRIELQLGAPDQKQAGARTDAPQFFDQPQFTVAGVTDATNHGGHGSDAVSRTTQSLTREVSALNSTGSAAPSAGTEASLRATLQNNPADFDANLRLGRLLSSAGRPGEALQFLEHAHQVHPDHDSARELANTYMALGKLPEARSTAEAALARQDSGDLHHLVAEIAEQQHEPLQAVREYQRAAELNPSETNLFDWGTELLAHRTLQPAIEVFTRGNQRYPHSGRILVGLGVAWYASGSVDQGTKYVCQAADLEPANPIPSVVLGKISIAEPASSPSVLDRLARFVKRQPDGALANYYYAVALWKQNQTTRSPETARQVEALLEKARQLDPKLAGASLQLGIVFEDRRDLARAVDSYTAAINADPQLREAHYRLAQLYRRTGEKAKADQELAAYNRISRQVLDQNEREAHEIPQFVYTLRDSKSPASQQ
jgi:tetratricopeptide (TPR) repeat protein